MEPDPKIPKSEPESPWGDLPSEVLPLIAKHLDGVTFCHLYSTNSQARSDLSEMRGHRQSRRIKLKQFGLKPEDEEVDLRGKLRHTGLTAELGEALGMMTALQQLELSDNPISDVSPLQGMTALQVLALSDNQISDVSPLQGMTALRELWLRQNQISEDDPTIQTLKDRGVRVYL